MDENNLQINITAVDDASSVIDSVSESADGMATAIGNASASIGSSLDAAFTVGEEAAIESATAAANAWMGAAEEVDGALATVAETSDGDFLTMSDAALRSANAASEGWQASLKDIASLATMTEEQVDAAFGGMATGAEDSSAKATGSMHSYFKLLIAGYLAQTAGKDIIGIVQDAVTAAAGDPTKLTDLTNQLHDQQAALAKLELPISGHNLTTAQLGADQADQAAKIATAKQKISELKEQIEPLANAQRIAGQAAIDYSKATEQLTQDWQTFLTTVGAPLLEHLANAAKDMDKVVTSVTAWAKEHPKLSETLLIGLGILGSLLVVVGGIMIALAPLIILFGMFGVAFSLASVAIALGVAAIIAGVAFLIAAIITNWDAIKKKTAEVWDAIINYLADKELALYNGVSDAFNKVLTFVQKIWKEISDTVTGVITNIENAIGGFISKIEAAVAAVAKLPAGVVGGAGNLISGAVKAFADGGIVNGPTLAMVGEAGPEAIIPLSAFNGGSSLAGIGGGGAGGLNLVFNVGNLYGTDSQTAARFANQIAKSINQQLKLKNYN